jgi:hypothetical protein
MADLPDRDAALLLDMLLAARDAGSFVEGSTRPVFLKAGYIKTRRSDRWKSSARRQGKFQHQHEPLILKFLGAK